MGWAKTVSNQSKIGLGHWRLPRAGQSPYYFTWVISDPLLSSPSLFSGSGSLSPKLAVCSTIGPRNYTGAPFHRSVLFMVVDSPQANLLFELRMRAVCGGS